MGLSRDDIGIDLIQRTASPAQASAAVNTAAAGVMDRQPGALGLGIESKGPLPGADVGRLNERGAFATSGQSWGEKSTGPDWGGPETSKGPEMQKCHEPARGQNLETTQGPSKDAPTKALTTETGKEVAAEGASVAAAPAAQPGVGTQILDWMKAHPVLTTLAAGTAVAGGVMMFGGGSSILSNLGTAAKIMGGVALLGAVVSMLMPKKEEKKAEEKGGSWIGTMAKTALLGAMNPVVGMASAAQSVIKKAGS